MLAKVKQGQTVMSSPLLSSARKKRNHSRTKSTKLLKSSDELKSSKNERAVLLVSENETGSDSGSVQTGENMDEGIANSVITRSSRSSRTKEKSLLVAQSDKNEIKNSEIMEEDEAARTRLQRLEKQLGGMTPLGFRETEETSNSVKAKSRQRENKGDSVSSAPADNELTSADKLVKSVKSKKHASVSKSNRTKKNIVTSNLEEDVGTSTDLQNNDPSQSKRKETNRKEIQRVASQSSSLHEPKKVIDKDLNVNRRRRGTAKGERSDSDNQSGTIQQEVSPEQAKKLEKLQKQLGGMSPMDRTLALLSESRAKLSKTMPSLLDLSDSQSKDDNVKESDNLTRAAKQGTKGQSKSTSSTKSQYVRKRKESSSKQEATKLLKIKLKVNKKKKMARGKAKVLIDSDPEEDVEEMQTSESEMGKSTESRHRRDTCG
ncbi:hypothetical protein HOLleu_44245 [Holothuria leucospilota]|uniref:Uncharacterized protein n=1 Tax=Holothuria leucospilota TaxID=206669 RepID=A0A9Q1BAA7_HOLLE|nr:hypothetical protein HOLleu_44245 [Holothuria leucospilota]